MRKLCPSRAFALSFLLALSILSNARQTNGKNQADRVCTAAERDDSTSSCEIQKEEDEYNGKGKWDFLEDLSQEDALVKWIQSLEGGVVNTQLFDFRRTDHVDGSLNPDFDLIATQKIPKGTVLMEIPPEAMIGKILTPSQESAFEDFMQFKTIDPSLQTHVQTCVAIESIANERQKKSLSKYHPYLEFVFGSGNPKHRRPTEWSAFYQELFWEMMGPTNTVYSPSQEHNSIDATGICETYARVSPRSQPPKQITAFPEQAEAWREDRAMILNRAYSYFSKHAWGTTLIPLFDLIPHRNGRWKNVEARFVDTRTNTPVALKPRDFRFQAFRRQTQSKDNKAKLEVYAHRDIEKGEPLRISLNQCEHLGCKYLELNYTSSELLSDAGILEEYPRRWSFKIDYWGADTLQANPTKDFILEIDVDPSLSDDESPHRSVRILQNHEGIDEIYKHAFLGTSIKRWRDLKYELEELTESRSRRTAQENHEYNTIHAYQKAYTEAFELAWIHRHDKAEHHQTNHKNSKQNTLEGYYDDLSEPKGPALYSRGGHNSCAEGDIVNDGVLLEKINGFYQKLEYFYEPDADNTYLQMNTWLHSASNFRAHYHESVIHVALQYVKNPKRVAYIGGGDNLVLAELLKYKNIDKIVGLELDQQVCRSSMKYFGTTPAYHDERVEWWYGNGALSVQLLPEDYFGSFDLVLVDLLTDVADGIKVTAGLSLSEIAALLMNPDGGVLARNDDYFEHSEISKGLAERVVMYDYFDAPRLCVISTTIASNSVDFVRGPRYDHGVETLVRLTNFDEDGYAGWARYYASSNSTKQRVAGISNSKTHDTTVCKKIQNALKDQNTVPFSLGGVLLIIEAENVTESLEPEALPHLHNNIEEIAKTHELIPFATSYQPEKDINAFVVLCERGYIKMQTFPQFQYVAFDLVLWGGSSFVDKARDIEKDLVATAGGASTKDSVSAFRVVTGGMDFAEGTSESNNNIVEKALHYYCDYGESEIREGETKSSKVNQDDLSEVNEKTQVLTDVSVFLPQLLSGITVAKPSLNDQKPFFVIFCGKEDAEKCHSYFSISSSHHEIFLPVYSCESFENMTRCESDVMRTLLAFVSERKRLDGFVLDPTVSLEMGKIIHKVFNTTVNQSKILEDSFSVVAKGGEGSWKYILLDRFRTEIILAPPVHMVEFEISNGEYGEAWSVVSVQNNDFLTGLQNSLEVIERKTGRITTTKKILDSIIPLVTDWDPVRPTDRDFFQEEAMDQWFGQRPVANQFFLQMEVDSKPASVDVNEVVLVGKEFMTEGATGSPRGFLYVYYEGTITEVKRRKKDLYVAEVKPYKLKNGETVHFEHRYLNNATKTIPRQQIRKISRAENDRIINIGDTVLIKERHPITKELVPTVWNAATVFAIHENGFTVRSKLEYIDLIDVSPADIMPYSESPEFSIRKEGVSLDELEFAFEHSAYKSGIARGSAYFKTLRAGNGYLVSFLAPQGSGIMKWDGEYSVEVNMLATERHFEEDFDLTVRLFSKSFLANSPSLKLIAKDSFPRGYGKVVNFRHDIVQLNDDGATSDYIPLWTNNHVPPSLKMENPQSFEPVNDLVN